MQGPRNNRLAMTICACLTASALASTAAMAGESVDSSTKVESTTADRSPTGLSMYTTDKTSKPAGTADADQSTTGSTSATEMRSDSGSASASSTTTSRDSASTSGTSDTSTGASGAATMAPGTTAVSPSPHDRSTSGDFDPRTSTDYDQSRTGGMRSNPKSGSGPDDLVWYAVPASAQNQGSHLASGCWVKFYSGDDFEGRSVSIVGPANVKEMRSPYGTGMNNWESAEVGPNATVTTYDDENFGSRNATLNAGQRYPDLDDSKLGLFDDIESLKVNCRTSTGTGGTN